MRGWNVLFFRDKMKNFVESLFMDLQIGVYMYIKIFALTPSYI